MGRAIAFMTAVVVVVVAGVFVDLWRRHPTPSAPRQRAPVLTNEVDGSVYDLTLKVDQLEQRAEKSEQRARQQAGSLTALRKQNDDLAGRVRDLEDEIDRLRREIARPPAPQSQPKPTNPASPGPAPNPAPPGADAGQPGGTTR